MAERPEQMPEAWAVAVQEARKSADKLGTKDQFLLAAPVILGRLAAEVVYTLAHRSDLAGEDLLAGSCLAMVGALQRLLDEADVLRPFLPHAETSRIWVEGAIKDALGDRWLDHTVSGG